uniref:Uncharacterized protein n=2 Tax=Avena sativa TaxID=4498 RepID=A0ACD5V349_AVESA
MAFFLSSYPSMLPPNSGGGNLGLHSGDGLNAQGINRFLAVEFDTYKNTYDSMFEHIGIDINTVRKSVSATSVNGSMIGAMTASITFNSTTRMLVASLHFDGNSTRGSYEVSKELTYPPVTDLLPSEVAVGFSAATGLNVELHQIMSWSFNSTLARKGTRNRVLFAALIGGPSVLLVILVVVILFSVACYKHKHRDDSFVKGVGDLAKRFEYRELAAATDEFSNSRELGQGAFGIVYEGELTEHDGQKHQVAVKKIKKTNGEIKDFHAELKTISETRHKNLVRLKGWCCRSSSSFIDFMCWWMQKQSVELFLVYELVPNGNLDVHLNKNEEVLTWAKSYVRMYCICMQINWS